MFKRMLSLLLCFVLAAGMAPAGAFAAEAGETLPAVDLTQGEAPAEETREEPQEEAQEASQEASQEEPQEETQEAPQEETQAELPEEAQSQELIWHHIVPDFGDYDPEKAFEGYARQQFYPTKMSLQGTAAGESLTGSARLVYNALASLMRDVASGQRSSAIFTMGATVGGNVPEFAMELKSIPTGNEFYSILMALRLDLNYEMYWFDFTQGFSYGYSQGSKGYYLEMAFAVAEIYSDGGYLEFSGGYRMLVSADTEKTGIASASAENARNVVAQFASRSDYRKLEGYAQWIADNTSYDYDAVNNDTFSQDINPWQMISAFDGDPSTKIVCEGYSKAFQYLCDLSAFQGDVECYKMVGYLNGGGHMWNHVRMGDKTYLVDVTCYDQDEWGYWDTLFMAGGKPNNDGSYSFDSVTYTYDQDAWDMWEDEGILILAEKPYDPSAQCDEHTWDQGTVTVEPTCTAEGTMHYCCLLCDATRDEQIPPLAHDVIPCEEREPTCEEPGSTGGSQCTLCGLIQEEPTVLPALGHDIALQNQKDADCEADGYTGDEFCLRCNTCIQEGTVIPALGHDTVVQDAVEPDCLHGGYSGDLLCTRCGVITEYGEDLEPLGHESAWVDTVEPDCENPGHTGAEVCGRCGEPLGDGEVLPALGHSPAEALFPAREATDTEYGNEEFVILACSRCGIYVHADGTPMTDGEIEELRLQHKTYAEAREILITLAEGGQIPEIINKSLYPEGLALKAQVLPATAKQEVTWSSGAKATATVEEGLVKLLKNGTVTITAKAENGKKGTVKLNIRTLAGSVTVTAGQNHLIPGKSLTLKAQVLPADASSKKVVWSTSHEELVTISASGVLKIRTGADLTDAPIEVLVTATAADGSGISGSWPVTLYPKTTKVTITQAGEEAAGTLILPVGGEPLELGCLLAPANARDAVTWKSSSTKTAQVNAQGQVTGLKPGTVTITATAADGSGRKDTVKIKVVQLMESLELPGEKILAGGKSFTFKAVIGPANTTTKTLRWYIVGDVPAGFGISKSGQLKTAAVTEPVFFAVVAEATDGSGAQAVCEVAVYPAAKKVELTDAYGVPITAKTLELPMGQTLQLGASITPEEAHDAVTWKTSSAKTAQVDETGLVTPLKPGTVTLTVTAADGSGKKDTVKIKVVQLMEGLTIPGTKDLAQGKSFAFKAQVSPANTTNKGVSWSLETPVDGVSISASGVLKVSKTARAESVTVVAAAKDGSGVTARCIVSIWPPVTKVTIVEPDEPIVLEVGECLDLEAVTAPGEACPNVTWKSSAAKTAAVDENGMVIALKAGTVTITATAADGSGKKDTIKIKIVAG